MNLGKLIRTRVKFSLMDSDSVADIRVTNDLWPLDVDPAQIHQVIYNLAVNAAQAMPRGGTVNLQVEKLLPGSRETSRLGEGQYVKITVRDHGVGIPQKNLPKIFNPYFTTGDEPTKKDCGLGLTIAHSIVRKIEVKSEAGRGASFAIHLSVSPQKAGQEQEAAEV